MRKVALTTVDNPFSPIDQFDQWHMYDISSGYHTTAFLGKILKTSNQLSEADQDALLELAIDEIVQENVLGVFKKFVKES